MKTSNLTAGLAYSAAGLVFLLLALLTAEGPLTSLLYGLAGAGIGPGAVMIVRHFYWSRPGYRERYQERLEEERIELRDERNTALRDRSGRYAYVLGLVVTCLAILIFHVLGALRVLSGTRVIVLYLGAYLLFQYVAGVVIYRRLSKR